MSDGPATIREHCDRGNLKGQGMPISATPSLGNEVICRLTMKPKFIYIYFPVDLNLKKVILQIKLWSELLKNCYFSAIMYI